MNAIAKLVAGLLVGCALPGVALAGEPLAQAAPPAPYAPPPAPYAPPPGPYGYPPPPGYPPPAYFSAQRLAVLDAQIRDLELRRDEISYAFPTTALIVGAALTVTGLVVVGANTCNTDSYGNKTDPSCVDNTSAADAGVLMFGTGIILGVIGTTSFIIRGARRRHVTRQIEARQLEANALRGLPPPPRLNFAPTRNGGGVLSLAFDF
jgi:hypothetical protein